MDVRIRHSTKYTYSAPVEYALQKVRLRPHSSSVQSIKEWTIDVVGGKIEASYNDQYGNHTDLIRMQPSAQVLTVRVQGAVTTLNKSGVLGPAFGAAPLWHFRQQTPLTTAGDAIKALPPVSSDPQAHLRDLHDLAGAILAALPYQAGQTDVGTSAEDAMGGSFGVCQDHAQIFVSAARLSGLPARYVSGYLMINDRIDQDATHAWAEVCLPELGWVGFDVSNGVSPDERYVRVACGRDAFDAAPVQGLRLGSADETLMVSLQVQQ